MKTKFTLLVIGLVFINSLVIGQTTDCKGIGQTSSYQKRGEFPQQNSTNPYLNFTEQDFTWRELEPTEGNYQWQILDDYIARWAGTGKKIIPHIVIAHNTTANPTYTNAVPQYVYDAGADYISYLDTMNWATYVRPVPWDTVFLGKFAAFVQAFAARYDGNPAIWNVDITLGLFSTTLLATSQSQAFPLYAAKGYTEPVWSDAIRQVTTIYRNAFHITPLRFVVTFFTGQDNGSAAGILAKEAAALGIIIHNHSLRAAIGFLNDPWLGLFEEIHQLYPSAKTSFGTDRVVVVGTIAQVVQYAFGGVIAGIGTFPESHISYFTLYPPDITKADSNSPSYNVEYRKALDSVKSRLEPDSCYLIGINNNTTEIPEQLSLSQNYPNPFNPKTIINFQLPTFNYVSLKIYDILGREIATLVNEELQPGTYDVDWDAANYPSGVYYYQLTSGDFNETRKMVLIK